MQPCPALSTLARRHHHCLDPLLRRHYASQGAARARLQAAYGAECWSPTNCPPAAACAGPRRYLPDDAAARVNGHMYVAITHVLPTPRCRLHNTFKDSVDLRKVGRKAWWEGESLAGGGVGARFSSLALLLHAHVWYQWACTCALRAWGLPLRSAKGVT